MTSRGVLSHFWREALTEDRPSWHVVCIDGHVRRPLAVTAFDLSRFPQRDVPVAGTGPESAIWRGVDVGLLLDVSGVEPGVRFAVFHSGERRISFSIEQVSRQNAVLALRAGDDWLSAHDGGPCRLVLAGTRWRDFGGPIDRVELCVERPGTAPEPDASGAAAHGTSARAG